MNFIYNLLIMPNSHLWYQTGKKCHLLIYETELIFITSASKVSLLIALFLSLLR